MMCPYCTANVPDGKVHCPACKNPIFGKTDFTGGDAETTLLGRKGPKRTKEPRFNVGIFNDVFGGSITPGLAVMSVNIVGGPPGAGKTTMFLMVSDMVLDQDPGEALYIATEQSDDEIEETGERLKLKNLGRIRVYNAMGGLRRDLGSILREFKPALTILDSVTRLVGDDMAQAVRVVEWFKEATIFLKKPTLIVDQVTKDGTHAGSNQVLHGGDGVFSLIHDDTTGERLLYSSKNRKGPAPKYLHLRMLPEDAERPGLLVLDPAKYNPDGSLRQGLDEDGNED